MIFASISKEEKTCVLLCQGDFSPAHRLTPAYLFVLPPNAGFHVGCKELYKNSSDLVGSPTFCLRKQTPREVTWLRQGNWQSWTVTQVSQSLAFIGVGLFGSMAPVLSYTVHVS